jgi:hypothetical protein
MAGRRIDLLLLSLLLATGCSTTWRPCEEGGDVSWNPPIQGNRRCSQRKDESGRFINHGEFFQYYEDGKVAIHGHFREGQRTGTWTLYDATGKKSLQKWYHKGVELPAPIPRGVSDDEYLEAFLKQTQTVTAPQFQFKKIETPPSPTQPADTPSTLPLQPKPGPQL